MMRLLLGGWLLASFLHAGTITVAPQIGASGNISSSAYDPGPAQSGVAKLTFSTNAVCSGVAIAPTVILTAAHCIGGVASGLTTYFTDSGSNSATVNGASSFLVHPGWSGDSVNQVDLALVFLTSPLAAWVTISELYTNNDEIGQIYQTAGWGAQSSGGAVYGSVASFGVGLRVGNNVWDGTASQYGGLGSRTDVLISDFDDVSQIGNDGVPNEATVAPGDSGGPSFLNGRVAGITSYSAATDHYPDGRYGEVNGMTRISSNLLWIQQNAGIEPVPEPTSFGLVGVAAYLIWAAKRRSGVSS